MKRTQKLLLTVGCIVLAAVAWLAALTSKSDARKQSELIQKAQVYMEDEAYVRAQPYLEEAAGYNAKHTLEAEEALKTVYLNLVETSGYRRKYTDLLDKQMARKNADPAVFQEAAQYYLDTNKAKKALEVLKTGIEKTGSTELRQFYEDNRYLYKMNRNTYQEVTAICNGGIQVANDGLWGLATATGSLVIPCEYDRISTYSSVAITKSGRTYSAVNSDNNRYALSHTDITDFGNLNNNRIGVKTKEGWKLANGDFATSTLVVDEIGMYSNGYIPAKEKGKWGFMDPNGKEWQMEPQYDELIMDELGRCVAQDVYFARSGSKVQLYDVDGKQVGDTYEDARPFANGWAAVKKDGKWGFIDASGEVKIDYQFDDALSFGQHLAAVQKGRYWGYINLEGKMVIHANFLEAKSFSGGSAPVKTADGWRFITLVEYEKEAGI